LAPKFQKLDRMFTVAQLKSAPKEQKVNFEAVLLVRKLAMKKARNNSQFLTVELGDRTGLFHTVCFENSANFELFNSIGEGQVIRVTGNTDYYQNRFSPTLQQIALVPEDEVIHWAESLVESAPEDLDELWDELQGYIKSIEHTELRETVRLAIDELGEVFKGMPGAISMHHAYRGGLMEHTVRMARAAKALLPLYPEVPGDLALAGIILHDIGKALEYTGPWATRKTREGTLNGHVVLGYRQARKAALRAKLSADLMERLEHIILSHQGEPEWGAAIRAATPEAVFVSMVDNLDAKMGMVQHSLRATPDEETFSDYIPGLMSPLLTAPSDLVRPPQPELATEPELENKAGDNANEELWPVDPPGLKLD